MRTLEALYAKVGTPKTIRMHNGSAFISRELDLRAYRHGVTLDVSRPGRPTENGFVDTSNSKLRPECLSAHEFLSLAGAHKK